MGQLQVVARHTLYHNVFVLWACTDPWSNWSVKSIIERETTLQFSNWIWDQTDPWSIDDIKLCTATMDLGSAMVLN